LVEAMKSSVLVVALALVLSSCSITASAAEVCHRTGGRHGFVLLDVGDAAVAHHLAHGDVLPVGGTCPGDEPPELVFCGGFASIPCEPGEVCLDVPGDGCSPECGGADCGGFCATFPPVACGRHAPCPAGFTCIDDPGDDCNPDCGHTHCATVCAIVTADACDGFAGLVCPEGTTCVDAPGDSCHPSCGGADCGGVCVAFGPVPCEGEDDCTPGALCVDDPSDTCGPECGGPCPGICALPASG
jgi:hypothetical protein